MPKTIWSGKRLFKLELEYPVFAVRAIVGKNAALAAPIFAFLLVTDTLTLLYQDDLKEHLN